MTGVAEAARRGDIRVPGVSRWFGTAPVGCAPVPLPGATPVADQIVPGSTVASRTGVEQRRVGLFGGTFDPPHVGHLVTAVNVRHALALDVVVLMVANVPWQKEGSRPITPAADRLAMVEAAVADVPGLEAGRLEIELGGPSFTADTLAAMADREPQAALFTIVGDDAAAGLTTWERYQDVVARSAMVVVDRPGEPVHLAGDVEWIHVEVPRLEVSSTDLRARFTDGRPLDYLVTDPVLQVIADRRLYQDPA
jgi:nicotinate-nucleotide adenylyltransferase